MNDLRLAKPAPCCDKPDIYNDLRRLDDEDGSTGLIIQIGCNNCNRVFAFMHPYAWQDVVCDNESGEDILKRSS